MQRPNQEQLRRLSAARQIVFEMTGTKPHITTLHRWATRGIAGVQLRTIRAGGYRHTCEQWIRSFFEAVSAAKDGFEVPIPVVSYDHQRRIDEASRQLEKDGI